VHREIKKKSFTITDSRIIDIFYSRTDYQVSSTKQQSRFINVQILRNP